MQMQPNSNKDEPGMTLWRRSHGLERIGAMEGMCKSSRGPGLANGCCIRSDEEVQ